MQVQCLPKFLMPFGNRRSLYFHRKQKIFFLLLIVLLSTWTNKTLKAQTTLAAGDVAIVGANATNPDRFALVLLKDITANTVFHLTDNGFTGSNVTGRTCEGFLTYTAPSNQTAGTVLQWNNGMTITGTGWSSAAPSNFSFNGAGDQLFVFQGSTANWATQSGITLLFGMNYGIALNATSAASNTLQPDNSILPSASFLNLSSSTYANAYFANGSVSTSTVSVTGTASALLALITDASLWYGNSSTAATFPAFTFNVSSGGSSPTISSTGTPNALNTIYGSASNETSFVVSGVNMTAPIVVTPPTGFEVSLSATSNFTNTVSVGTSGTISSTTIYIRLRETTFPGSYAGNIQLSSTGASNVIVVMPSSIVQTKDLNIISLTANNKAFDGNTIAYLSGTATLDGLLTADIPNVILGGTPVSSFTSSAVGTNIPVTVTGYTINGSAAAYYNLVQPAGLTANITSSGLQNQTITFVPLPNKTTADAPFALTATVSSGLPVNYTSSNTSVASISGNVLSFLSAGTTTITASQACNGTYNPAIDIVQQQVVFQKQLTVNGTSVQTKTYDGTINAILVESVLSGIVGADNVSINNTGSFVSSNACTGIIVTSTQTLSGANTVHPTGGTTAIALTNSDANL